MLGLALKMRGRGAAIILIAISVLYLASQSSVFSAAGINQTINFQGKVVNSDGTNVTNGNYDFVFRLYKASSGGVAQWTETWNSGTSQVTVTDGIFRVALGAHQSMSSLDFNDDSWYLSVEFNGDGEMDPRIRFAAVPYAFNAKTVSGLTVTNTTGTLTVPNGETISFAESFTTSGANPLTLTTTGTTNVTLPTTGTLATLDGNETLTNKTIGSTGLTFSGASLDITTATDEDLTITPNGDGDAVFNLASTGDFLVQDATTNFVQFLDDGTITLGKGSGAGTINIGIGTAADVINIGTDNTSGDTLSIGNSHTATTLSLTGGDDWSISSTGNLTLAGTTGITLTGSGADLIFANSERITNDTNGTITFARNDAGTVTVTAADNDAVAAMTVLSGGAAAMTVDAGGAAPLNLGNTNATSITLGNSSTTAVDIIAGTATVNIADDATTKTIDLGGVTNSGSDTINIATNATAADTISIGNTHTSTALTLTGGDDWLITATGSAHMKAWEGGGLYDNCNGQLHKIIWDSSTKQFGCATDIQGAIATPDAATFTDTTAAAFADNNTTELFNDTPRPNITVEASNAPVLVAVQIRGDVSNTTADAFLAARVVFTNDGSAPSCSTSTQAGQAMIGGFTTNTTHPWQVVGSFIHVPGAAGLIRYTVCTSSLSVGTVTDTPEAVQVSLAELGNANTNWTTDPSTGTVQQNITTLDILAGGTTTGSAKFSVLGMANGNTPSASVSATTGANAGKGVAMFGDSSIQSHINSTLTVGGNTTGNIVLSPRNSVAGASVSPGADDTVDLGTSSSARFRNLFLGPDSLHLQCLAADGCGQNLDYAISVNTATNALYISANGAPASISIHEGGMVNASSSFSVGSGNEFSVDGNGNVVTSGDISVGSGTVYASTFDAEGATGITIGSGDVTGLTITTDGTGDGEVTLPAQSIGASEILNDAISATQLASSIQFADGDLIDLSLITHNDSAPQGIILPQASSFTSPSSGEGYLAWNTSSELVEVFDGSNWKPVAVEYDFDDIYDISVAGTNTTMEIDNTAGLEFDLTSSGDFLISDAGTAFVQFLDDGTVTLGKSSGAGTINIGTGTAIDTINIGTGASGADVITVGGGSGTLEFDSGNITLTTAGLLTLYDTIELSGGAGEGIRGGGLTDCDGTTDKLLWDSTTNKFSCGTDSNIIAVFDAYDNTGGDNIATGITVNLDTTRKNSDGSIFSLASDVLTINETGTYTFQFRVSATLTAGTRGAIRAYMEEDSGGGFTEIEGTRAYAYGRITTYPEATAVGFYTMDVTAGDQFRVRSLVESGTFSTVADGSSLVVSKVDGVGGSGGPAGSLAVRETDSSPSVSDVATLEFGPSSSSSDEFIVTDETGGVARVRLGNEVGMLNQNETVSGAWTFNGTNTTFSTGLIANGGLTSSSGTNMSFTPGGTGDLVVNLDADTNVQFAASAAPGVDMFSLSNVGFGTTTDAVDGLQIDFVTAAVAGARTNSALQINVTSGATEVSDNLYGISIGNLTSPGSGTEVGLTIGTGWDTGIVVQEGGITVQNGGLTVTLGSLAVNSDSITSDGSTLTINAGGEVEIQDNLEVTGTTGLTLSGSGADVSFANQEFIANDTDDEILLQGAGGSNNAGLIIDLDGAGLDIPTLRAVANDLITIFDGLSIGIDGNNTENISLTGFSISGGNDLYIDDLLGVNGDVYIDGTINTVGGLTFNGTATDITTATDEDLTFVANGTGHVILSSDFNSGVKIGSSTNTPGVLSVSGGIGLNAAMIINQTAHSDSDILAASSSGVTRFVVKNDGTASSAAGFMIDGAGSIGSTRRQTFTLGGATTGNITIDSGTGNVTLADYASCDIIATDANGLLTCKANGPDVIAGSNTNTVNWADNNTTDVWNTTANLQITIASGSEVLVMASFRATGDPAAQNVQLAARIDREGAGSASDCSDTNTVGPTFSGTYTDNAAGDPASQVTGTTVFVDSPGASGTFEYEMCTSADTVIGGGTWTKQRNDITLYEVNDAGDLAEVYPTNDSTLSSGEVVTMDPVIPNGIKRASRSYDKNVIGIITTKPALVIGGREGEGSDGKPVALTGRVPVKVTSENGKIYKGDVLTSANTPGYAMKATKAGTILGVAMDDFTEGQEGTIMAFVKPGYFNGSNLREVLEAHNPNLNLTTDNLAKSALTYLLDQKSINPDPVDVTELINDRVTAGLEIITPHVITSEISLETIRSVNDQVALVLTNDGKFAVQSEIGEEAITFDNAGNAFFKGTLTAGKVKAGQIEGIEILAGSISRLEGGVMSLQDLIASGGAEMGEDSVSLADLQSLDLAGGLIVGQSAQFKGESIFEKLATFMGKVVFKNTTKFEKTPEFNRDTAGFAVIRAGDSRVHVEFENQYYYTPIINANIVLSQELNPDGTEIDRSELERSIFDEGYQLLISNRSAKGFDIVLNTQARTDIPISWTALSSFNAHTFQTQGIAGFSATPQPSAPTTNTSTSENQNTPDPEEGDPEDTDENLSPTPLPQEPAQAPQNESQEEGGENL